MSAPRHGSMHREIKIAAGAALLALAGLAAAADFEGPYVGVNVGVNSPKTSTDHSASNVVGGGGAGAAFSRNTIESANPTLGKTGFTGGAQAGYSWRSDKWVVGFEVDANYMDLKNSSTSARTFVGGGGSVRVLTIADSEKGNWVTTIRPRIGYMIDEKSMGYVTGGLAFNSVKYSNSITNTNVPTCGPGVMDKFDSSASKKRGWAAGGGYERGLSENTTLRFDYQHVQFKTAGTSSTDTSNFCGASDLGAATVDSDYKLKSNALRVGVNWHF